MSIKVKVGTSNKITSVPKGRQGATIVGSGAKQVSISDIIDVDASTKTDGSVLVYDEPQGKFFTTTLLEKQTVNGGNF